MSDDDLRELARRLERALGELNAMSHAQMILTEQCRLNGKATGVALALSYVREYLRADEIERP